jgi:antitoxin component YwqK of YwqJK toxin-antitoxin module
MFTEIDFFYFYLYKLIPDNSALLNHIVETMDENCIYYYPEEKYGAASGASQRVSETSQRVSEPSQRVRKAGSRRNGKKNGPWYNYHENGTIMSTDHWREGVKIGEWRGYHNNGELKYIKRWDDQGEEHGTWEWFFTKNPGQDTANRGYVKNWHHGMKHGEWKTWDDMNELYNDQVWKYGHLESYNKSVKTTPSVSAK